MPDTLPRCRRASQCRGTPATLPGSMTPNGPGSRLAIWFCRSRNC